MRVLLKFVIGGAKVPDLNTMERMGPASNPRDMVGLVGDCVYCFDTFVCMESRGYK